MGCWNHTCAITNLPIYAGEKVEVILLKNRGEYDGSSFCHPDAYHLPIPLTFSGIYDDYGAVEDCEGVALELIVESLRKHLVEMEVGENKYHDIPAKKDEFNIDKLFELDHEGRLFIINQKMMHDMRDGIRVKHIVVRKEVYDGIISGMTFERWDREKSETYYTGYDDLVKEYEQFTKDIDDIRALDPDDFKRRYWRMDGKIGETFIGGLIAYRGQGTYGMDYPLHVVETLFDMRDNGNEDFAAMLDNAVRLSMLSCFIEGARKSWVVPSGAGSQDGNTNYQTLCANLTLTSAKIVDNYYGEEDE